MGLSTKRKAEELEVSAEEESDESAEDGISENKQEENVESEDGENLSDEDNPTLVKKVMLVKELRAQLNERTSLSAVRKYFMQDNEYNHIAEYIKDGGSVGELMEEFIKFNTNRKASTVIVFSAIHQVIIKILTEFPNLQAALADDCKRFISDYVREITIMLTPQTVMSYQKKTMNLLTALASVNNQIASQLISTFDLSKEVLNHFTEHYNPLDKNSLRVYYMQFIMALMIDHDSGVLTKLCSKKGWISSIFPNMKYDLFENVVLFLKTLEKCIVLNKDLSKTSKLYVFNSHALEHLSSIYYWCPKDFIETRKCDKKFTIEDTNEEELKLVRDQVHQLLLVVCTSSKFGVVFSDSTHQFFSSDKNKLLKQFLKNLGQPWEDELKNELVCKTLQACPELLQSYSTFITPYLAPSSPKCLKAINLMTKVISDFELRHTSITCSNAIKMVQNFFLPHVILEFASKHSVLLFASTQMRLAVYRALNVGFDKASKLLDCLGSNKFNFTNALMQHLINNSLNAEILLGCIKADHLDSNIVALDLGISTLLLINSLAPYLLDTIRHNKEGIELIQNILTFVHDLHEDLELKGLLILRLLKLDIILKPQPFKEGSCLKKLNLILLANLNSPMDVVRTLALDVLKELFTNTEFFTESGFELDLWIHCINNYPNEALGELLAESLEYAYQNKYIIYNTLLRVHDEKDDQIFKHSNDLDYLIKAAINDTNKAELEFSSTSETTGTTLSPLLPSIFNKLKTKEMEKSVMDFLTMFMIHYAHSLDSFVNFNALLSNYSSYCNSAIEKVQKYLKSWERVVTDLKFSPFKNTIYQDISTYLLNEEASFHDIISKVESEDIVTQELCFKQILFILKRLSVLGINKEFVIARSVLFLKNILKQDKFPINVNELFYGLFNYFCPTQTNGLNHVILELMDILKEQISPKTHNLFANRFCFDLKVEKEKKSYLENCQNFELLLFHLKLSEENVKALAVMVFAMDEIYFVHDGASTQWGKLLQYLLVKATEMKIEFRNKYICGVISKIKYLYNKKVIIDHLNTSLVKYFKTMKIDYSSKLLDGLSDLFSTICMSCDDVYYQDLTHWLVQILENHSLLKIPELVSLDCLVISLAALNKCGTHFEYLFQCHVKSIVKLFIIEHSWIHYLKAVVMNVLSPSFCENLASRIIKKSNDIQPSKGNLDVMCHIFSKCGLTSNFILLVHNWLMEDVKNSEGKFCESITSKYLDLLGSTEIDHSSLPKYTPELIRYLIRHGMSLPSPPMLNLLQHWVGCSLSHLSQSDESLSNKDIFDLLTSHSMFVSILLQNELIKESLLQLISTLIKENNSLPQATHIPLFLAAYKASLSKTDQLILLILQEYEKCGVNMTSCKPFLWSTEATEYYTTKSKKETSNPSLTLEHLDMSIIERTVVDFPLSRDLSGMCDQEREDLYDPAFIIPVLCQLIEPESKIPVRKFFQCGALAVVFASLASAKPGIRASGYYFIKKLYEIIPKGKESVIWLHFINSVRSGIVNLESHKENKRLSSIVATFLAKASLVMASPLNEVYAPIHNFIYAKSAMDLNSVPAFLEFFNNTKLQRVTQQMWILEVIRDGLREPSDFQLLLNSFVFKIILDYYSSSLASKEIKNIIQDIIAKCLVGADKDLHLLINNYSILPWIHCAGKVDKILTVLPKKLISHHKHIIAFISAHSKDENSSLFYNLNV